MSSWWDEIEDRAIWYSCDYCGARTGFPCVVRGTRRGATSMHGCRTSPWQQMWAKGYQEGYDEGMTMAFEHPDWARRQYDKKVS